MLQVATRSRALDSVRMSSEATTSSWLATYMAARAPITAVTPELPDSSRRSAEPHLHFRRQNGSWLCARLAAGLNQSPRAFVRASAHCVRAVFLVVRPNGPVESTVENVFIFEHILMIRCFAAKICHTTPVTLFT